MDQSSKGTISRRAFLAGLAGVSLLRLPMQPAQALPQFDPFSFIFVSDVHLVNGLPDTGEKMLQESQLFLQEAIKHFNILKPDFVLFGGDNIETVGKDDANWNLFGDVVQQLQVPWSFVLGEEDVSGKIPPEKMRTFGADWRSRGIETNNSYWSLNPVPGVHLIGLDSSLPNTHYGEFSQPQLEWLKDDLVKNRGKLTIVFTHHPLLPPPPYDGGPPWSDYASPNGSDVREILGTSSDVKLVVSGHLYTNKVQIERDVWHVSAAGLNIYPCQYKMFRVSRNGILMESFPVNFPALVKKARKALQDSNLAYKYSSRNPESFVQLCEGSREDQSAFLSLTGGKTPQPLSKKDKQDLEALDKASKEKGKKELGKDSKKSDDKSANKSDAKPSDGKSGDKAKPGRKSRKGAVKNEKQKSGSGSDAKGKNGAEETPTVPDNTAPPADSSVTAPPDSSAPPADSPLTPSADAPKPQSVDPVPDSVPPIAPELNKN